MDLEAQKTPGFTTKLRNADEDLLELRSSLRTGMVNVKVLMEFRQAIEHARNASAAVQQYLEQEKSGGDPFAMLPKVVQERMQMAIALLRDVTQDIEGGDIDFDTPRLPVLHRTVATLQERLLRFFPK